MIPMVLLQAVTPLHVGEGAAVGAVNLPVARERATGWPFVPGSELKGALRAWAELVNKDEAQVDGVFGPKREEGRKDLRAGSGVFGTATLLALAVRSLGGGMALLSCPLALARFRRLAGLDLGLPEVSREGVLLPEGSPLPLPDRRELVILEDLPFAGRVDPVVNAWAGALSGWGGDGDVPVKHLAVVHDRVFQHAATWWLPTRTRAAIDDDGVVKDGQLFTTESLGCESLLAAPLSAPAALLPDRWEAFGLGGQRTVGQGRVVLLPKRSEP